MFYQILQEIMEEENLSIPDVARMTGLADSTIRSIISRKSKTVALEVAFKIANGLNVDIERLNGNRDMPKTQAHPILQKYNSLDPHGKEVVDSVLSIEYERIQENNKIIEIQKKYPIQEYEERVSAGTGNNLDYASAFITELDYEPPKCADFIVRVAGDSMEPTYSDGDRLFIHRTKDFNYGDIGIFFVPQDGLVVKEYTTDGLVSHNKDYEVIKADNRIEYVGKVIGKVK